MPIDVPAGDIFPHIRIAMGVIVGLAITRLLTGAARFIQHPERQKVSWIHLGWVFSILLILVHFWWWEFALFRLPTWTFGLYAFLLLYAIVLFLLCTLLFPDDVFDYTGYEGYLLSRRRWFFGVLAFSFLIDLADTWIKGAAYFHSLGPEYLIRAIVYIGLCGVAMVSANKTFHKAFVTLSLIYEVTWIARLYDTVG
jgi:hypothetical protein